MLKKTFLIALTLLICAAGYVAYDSLRYHNLLTTPASDNTKLSVRVRIPDGMTLTQAAAMLDEKEVIVDARIFVRYLKSQGWETKIQAGEYILKPSAVIPDLAKRLTGQISDITRLTVPEGFTVNQINDLLLRNNLVKADEFLVCLQTCLFNFSFLSQLPSRNLEGFLFPETYLVDTENFTPDRFLFEILTQTSEILSKYNAQITAGKRTLYEIMIMASMIEKETVSDEERPIVSGILWKRLEHGWFLAVDATTRYELNDWGNPLMASDLASNTPYNTRKRKGLPPTPICNPGEKSIRAAIFPEESPYWYYLHDRQGQVRYARTQEEHDTNRAKYLGNI